MSTSVPANTPDQATVVKRNRTMRRWVTAISAVVLTVVMLLMVRIQGSVSGTEFSPTHFQQRRFSFYEIPLLHLQITPIKRKGATPDTARYVRQKSLVAPGTGVPTTWHLVSISRGITGPTPADANLLVQQLNLSRDGDDYWHQWSKDHPAQAQILWPLIQKLAERELYLLMPTLFELAQAADSPNELQRSLDAELKQQYRGLIRDMRDAGRGELADSLIEELLLDYPEDSDLRDLKRPSTGAS